MGGGVRMGNNRRLFSRLIASLCIREVVMRPIIVAFFLVLSAPVFALDYYWTFPGASSQYTSANAACEAIAGFDGRYYRDLVVTISDVTASCRFQYSYNGSNWNSDNQSVSRRGDSCPDGYIYDQATGSCQQPEEDPCEAKSGQSQVFTKTGTAGDGYFTLSGGYGIPAQGACSGGCAVSTVDQKCTSRVTGAYSCRGVAYFTGQACEVTGSGTDVTDAASDTPEPEPQTITEETPCEYVQQSDGTLACASHKSVEKEGQSCGTVNGVSKCVDAAPSKNGIDIRTEVTTESLADGGTKTTKTDVATFTTCTGINQCTTTTTTNKTTVVKDSSGNTVSEGSTCTGSACKGADSGTDSDDDGICDTGDCGTDGESLTGQDWYESGDDTYASVLQGFADRVVASPMGQASVNYLSLNAGGACPRWSASVWVFDIELDQFCSGDIPWAAIKAVILAAAGFLAFRMAFF